MTSDPRVIRVQDKQSITAAPRKKVVSLFSCGGALPSGDEAESAPDTVLVDDRIDEIIAACRGAVGDSDSEFELYIYDDDTDETGELVATFLLDAGQRRTTTVLSRPRQIYEGNELTIRTVTDGGHSKVTVKLIRPH